MIKQDPILYIVEDDEILGRCFTSLFSTVKLKTEIFTSAEECLRLYKTSHWGCFLIDVRLPGINGLELQEQLRQRGNHMPIIMITAYEDIALAVKAMKMGARDFIVKPINNNFLLELVQKTLIETKEQQTYQQRIIKYLTKLTMKEKIVMNNVIAGKSNKAMAAELNLSISTIEQRRARIMRKMQAATIVDLVKKIYFIQSTGLTHIIN